MARKKKKISSDEVAKVLDQVEGASADSKVKAHAEKKKSESPFRVDIKEHSKFDKFKGENK